MSASSLPQVKPAAIKPGFENPVFDAQSAFRSALLATSYPGRVQKLKAGMEPPPPLNVATAAICLALLDYETPLWLDPKVATPTVVEWLRFHCGAPIAVNAGEARFAVLGSPDALGDLNRFQVGNPEYPDRSATLIVQTPSLSDGIIRRWRGPGIQDQADVAIGNIGGGFWTQREDQRVLYPCGLDFYFTSKRSIIGLPRAVQVEV